MNHLIYYFEELYYDLFLLLYVNFQIQISYKKEHIINNMMVV
jgi:hypothetical protein